MKQPDKKARKILSDISMDVPEKVAIPGTKRNVKIRGMKPYTIERLTAIWAERDLSRERDVADYIKEDAYFNHKISAIFVLNGFWRLKLFFWFLWRWYAFVRQYTQDQLTPILMEGKKKIPRYTYWINMVLTLDMRNDWMTMTEKEAESYQAELILDAKQHSSKNSQLTEEP